MYEFDNQQKAEAQQVADDTARVDKNTWASVSKEEVVKNKAIGHLAEIAVKEYCETHDLDYSWKANEDDSEPPHDFIIEGTKADVKSSSNSHNRCNLMLDERMMSKSRDNDSFILVRVEDDLSKAEIYGAVTKDDFHEYSHYFSPCQQHRMMNDELTEPTVVFGSKSKFTFSDH